MQLPSPWTTTTAGLSGFLPGTHQALRVMEGSRLGKVTAWKSGIRYGLASTDPAVKAAGVSEANRPPQWACTTVRRSKTITEAAA